MSTLAEAADYAQEAADKIAGAVGKVKEKLCETENNCVMPSRS